MSPSKSHHIHLLTTLLLFASLAITSVNGSGINGYKSSRKLDQAEDETKCGGCTPQYYYSSPPPPPPKKPRRSTAYCPPPPPTAPYSGFVYVTGPPGSLYPIDQTYYNSGGPSSVVNFPVALTSGLLALLLVNI